MAASIPALVNPPLLAWARKPRAGGFASPVDKALSRGGRPFAQLVLEALDANRITSVDASHYLDLRFNHVEKLREEVRRGPGQKWAF